MHCRTSGAGALPRPKHAAETTHAVTASHTALRTTVLPIEATPTYASSISTSVPAVFVRFVAPSPRRTRGSERRRAARRRGHARSRSIAYRKNTVPICTVQSTASQLLCEDARALARMCGACEMIRRRDNLNRTFRKCEIGHFVFHKCEIGHFAFRKCEIGHFGMTKYQIEHAARHSQRVSGGVTQHPW